MQTAQIVGCKIDESVDWDHGTGSQDDSSESSAAKLVDSADVSHVELIDEPIDYHADYKDEKMFSLVRKCSMENLTDPKIDRTNLHLIDPKAR